MKYLLCVLIAGFLATAPGVAQERVSAVQAAAAAILAKRLGKLRGAIKPDDASIYITTDMLEQNGLRRDKRGDFRQRLIIKRKNKLPPIVWNKGLAKDKNIDGFRAGTKGLFGQNPGLQQDLPDYGLTLGQNAPSAMELRLEELEQIAGKLVAQFVPKPITRLEFIAGNYRVAIPVNR